MRVRNILILLAILLALGGYFYFSNAPQPPEKKEPRLYAWMIDLEEIQRVEISLPHEGKSEAFIKIPRGDQFPWFFDDPQRSDVDVERWGGGIPLLLSGPGVDRIIARDAPEEKLTEYGLTQPSMEIDLTLEDSSVMNIKVGNETLDGRTFYVQAPDSNDVALVDYSWYRVLERLVTEPPYAPATGE